MNRSVLSFTLFVVVVAALFASCTKEAAEKDPEVVICYFEPYLPVRVINTAGEDLLSPAKLSSGTIEINWTAPGSSMSPVKMSPAAYYKQGQADQYYFSVPMRNTDKGLTIVFSLKSGESDTLFIKTATHSSKPFGVTDISFNGARVDPTLLFGSTVYGLELIKWNAGK
jgi:hypothetical protein